MSTLISRQGFNALVNSFRRPPRPRNTTRLFSHRVGDTEVPISEPPSPSYGALARRFSSYPAPLNHHAVKSWQKAGNSGGYVDVHELCDISDIDPNKFDVLITDVNEKTLRTEVSKVFGIDYLAKATEEDAKRKVDVISGYLYGDGRRPMVPCVVSNADKAYWVHFIVDTGSPATFLSEKVCNALDLRTDASDYATIGGCYHQIRMSPARSHFVDINILGSDFCDAFKFTALYLGGGKVKYFFKDRWAGAKELYSKL